MSREGFRREGNALLFVELSKELLVLLPLLPGLCAPCRPFLLIMGQGFVQVEDCKAVQFVVWDGIKINERSYRG